MRFILALPALTALTLLAGCDLGTDTQSLREKLGVELTDADISLAEAIAIAQGEVPGATVLEAELDVHETAITYDVELLLDGVEHEVDVSPTDGSVLRNRSRALDTDDRAEAESAGALVDASAGWADLIAKAEAEAGAVAFDVEADGDDGVLEIELLGDAGIWEIEMRSDGTIVKSEASDDDTWETEQEGEHAEDDDDDDGVDDDDDATDDDGGSDDDGADEPEVEDDGGSDDDGADEPEVEDDGGSDDDGADEPEAETETDDDGN
jgi:hypothetical protein